MKQGDIGVIVSDDDGHDYFIDPKKLKAFQRFVDSEGMDGDFDDCRIEAISQYVFRFERELE